MKGHAGCGRLPPLHRTNATMLRLPCPYCGERTVNPLRKLLFGPMFEHRCSACRRHWGISQWSIVVSLIGLPVFYLFVSVVRPTPLIAQWAGIGILVSVAVALMFLVPVVRK